MLCPSRRVAEVPERQGMHRVTSNPSHHEPAALHTRGRWFSGWTMLALSCLAVFISGPAQTYGVSVFVDPMLDDFGWSRSLFSMIYSAGTLAGAGVLVIAGRQIDRLGNRIVMVVAAVLFGAAMFFLSFASGIIAVLIGFAFLRSFGSGVLTLGARTLVPRWFHSRAGRAFSILGLAAMASQAVIPAMNNFFIDRFGWQHAWRLNGLLIWLLVVPLIALLVRNRPEDVGQLPDGQTTARDPDLTLDSDEAGITLHQALRTPTFWCLIGASVVPSLVVTGLAFNQVAILTNRGMPSTFAATTFAIEAAVAVPVTIAAGWLVDRYPVRYVLMLGQVFLLVSMACLAIAETMALVIAYSSWRGASSALWTVAADVAWPSYFGRKYLGSIRGAGFAVGVVGAAIGPIPFGLSYDLLGNYTPAIVLLMILPIAAAIAVLQAKPPTSLHSS